MKKTGIVIFLMMMFFAFNVKVEAESLDCTNTLRQGSSGSNVKILQRKLNNYTDCNLEVDGKFGSKTYACVTKFQNYYNLQVDGIVGKKTCSKLNQNNLKKVEKFSIAGENAIIVKNAVANIRSGSGTNYSVLTKVKRGRVFYYNYKTTVNGTVWYNIDINNTNAFISSKVVSNNFVVVDISDQKLIYYADDEVVIDTDVVTGTKGVHDTPVGLYHLDWKTTNYHMKKYNVDVDYWMPFTESGIGFHDANGSHGWRDDSEFGGATYINNGSHGCVNMKVGAAKKLYRNIDSSVDIIIKK